MYINRLPFEIFDDILEQAARLNEREGVAFTFGFSKAPVPPPHKSSLQRYIKGYVPPDLRKWDATASIRLVCSAWHEWGLNYALQDVYIQKGRGSERWAELPLRRGTTTRPFALQILFANPRSSVLRGVREDRPLRNASVQGPSVVTAQISNFSQPKPHCSSKDQSYVALWLPHV